MEPSDDGYPVEQELKDGERDRYQIEQQDRDDRALREKGPALE